MNDSTQTIRYAPHIERVHTRTMDESGNMAPGTSILREINKILDFNTDVPYEDYEAYDIDDAFFGRIANKPDETYEIRSFPSLYDMFGKFMAGLDIHVLWADVYEDTVHGPEIAAAVSAQSALLDNEIKTKVLPSFLAGMRDINAIQSTTFVIGKAIIADSQIRQMNEFQSRIRLSAVELSGQLWRSHLDWSKNVVAMYAEMTKLYYSTKLDVDKEQLEYAVKLKTWNVDLFDSLRTYLGALNGAASTLDKGKPSQAARAIGGALSGAAAGASIGGPYGAAAGAALGIGSAFLS